MLTLEKAFEIRFSEIDMMHVVWHGAYPLYLEDAREAFGTKYGLSYQRYLDEQIFAPIVEMNIKYKRPLVYGMKPIIKITYEIRDSVTDEVCLTASMVQVFMDRNYQLIWYCPKFYEEWKQAVGVA